MHHWAALLFTGAVLVHLLRVFFTGAFRRPRELNWIIGVTLLVLIMFNGFSGYSLPDDLPSGTGLRIGYSIALAVPVIGTWAAFLVFGGGPVTGHHLSPVRAARAHHPGDHRWAAGCAHGHPVASEAHPVPWARPDRRQHRRLPSVADIHGPFGRSLGRNLLPPCSAGCSRSTPSGCTGRSSRRRSAMRRSRAGTWGGSRGHSGWRRPGGSTCSGTRSRRCSGPGCCYQASPSVCSTCGRSSNAGSRATPPITTSSTGPRERPVRTAIGVGGFTFYSVLFVAGSSDIGAQKFVVGIPTFTRVLQVLVVVLPIVAALITWKICRDLNGADQLEAEKERIRRRLAPVAEEGQPA